MGQPRIKVVALSQKGSRSDENEDSYLCLKQHNLFVVADGVGGGPNGKIASRIVIKAMSSLHRCNVSRSGIVGAIESANEQIRARSEAGSVAGMASTVTALWVDGNNAVVFNVGDSRIYRFSQEKIDQLSNDHSKILENDKKSKNVITNAVGARQSLNVEVEVFPLRNSDSFLLVSDGISDPLSDEKMCEILCREGLTMLDRCLVLASEAEKCGGRDDKTVILIATS